MDQEEISSAVAGVTETQERLTSLVQKLVERIEQLESSRDQGQMSERQELATNRQPRQENHPGSKDTRCHPNHGGQFQGNCWVYNNRRHLARDCPCKQVSKDNNEHVMQTSPVGGSKLIGSINGTTTSFLIDTRAAVTVIRSDFWKQTGSDNHSLTPWSGCRLVGMDGSPLKIHGQASTKLEFQNKEFKVDVVIAEALAAEAILGLDFLTQIWAKIDLANQKIVLPDDLELLLAKGGSTGCGNNATNQSVHILSVCLLEGLKIPPLSEIEVITSVADQVADDKPWMFEAVEWSRLPVAIARGVVRLKLGQIPVWLVNAGNTAITLYLKTTLRILEELADSEPTTDCDHG